MKSHSHHSWVLPFMPHQNISSTWVWLPSRWMMRLAAEQDSSRGRVMRKWMEVPSATAPRGSRYLRLRELNIAILLSSKK